MNTGKTSPDTRRRLDDGTLRDDDDEPIPPASEDAVLEETARLAREGRRELDADERERGWRGEDSGPGR